MIESASRIQAFDRLAKNDLEASQVFVGLGKLGPCVAEEVLHLRYGIPKIYSESAGVLASRDSADVTGGVRHFARCRW